MAFWMSCNSLTLSNPKNARIDMEGVVVSMVVMVVLFRPFRSVERLEVGFVETHLTHR